MHFRGAAFVLAIISTAASPTACLTISHIDFMLNLTRSLHEIYKFENFIVFKSCSTVAINPHPRKGRIFNARSDSDNGKDFIQMLANKFHVPTMIFMPTNFTKGQLDAQLAYRNFAVVIMSDIDDQAAKDSLDIALSPRKNTKIVFLLPGKGYSLQQLKDFFSWCFSHNLLKILLVFEWLMDDANDDGTTKQMEIYSYRPFLTPIRLIRYTGQNASEFYPNTTTNLQGYQLKTPVMMDKPHAFKTTDKRTGRTYISGVIGHLIVEFLNYINGSFIEVVLKNTTHKWSLKTISNLLSERTIDIGIHPFIQRIPIKTFLSDPFVHTNTCVVVPVVPDIYPALYMGYTFDFLIWMIFLVMFACMVLLQMLNSYSQVRRWNFIYVVGITFRGLLHIPPHYSKWHYQWVRGNCRIFFTSAIQFYMGMMFTNLYMASLTSLLSTTIYGRQIETIEDMRAAGIQILMQRYQAFVYHSIGILPENFSAYVRLTDPETVARHQDVLNTSYAYVVEKHKWLLMQQQQKNLWKPVLKVVPKMCIPNIFLSLPIQENAPFLDDFNQFILQGHASGLYKKWNDMTFHEIQQTSDYLSLEEHRTHPMPLSLTHFEYVWYALGGGLTLASIVFIFELKRFGKKRK